METQELKNAFVEMTNNLIQRVMNERENAHISPEILREIRSNVWNLMEQERRANEPHDDGKRRMCFVAEGH